MREQIPGLSNYLQLQGYAKCRRRLRRLDSDHAGRRRPFPHPQPAAGAPLSDAAANGATPTVSGFAATDTIDLTTFKFGTSETLPFAERAQKTSGTLTIKDGALKASIILFGQYVAGGFYLTAAGAGTAITYATPTSAHVEIAGGTHRPTGRQPPQTACLLPQAVEHVSTQAGHLAGFYERPIVDIGYRCLRLRSQASMPTRSGDGHSRHRNDIRWKERRAVAEWQASNLQRAVERR
jgi:hypothetical protein